MTWQQTHARWLVVNEIEDRLSREPDHVVGWEEGYAGLFGDRVGLRAFLRYRWELRLVGPTVTGADAHPALRAARLGLAALDREERRPQEDLRVPA